MPYRCRIHNNEQRRKRGSNKRRTKDSFYSGRRWRRVRLMKLARDPLCEECGAAATDVDHVQPRTQGGADYDLANLSSLCHGCHSQKTNKERA